METNLTGKSAIITGGASGMGRAIAKLLTAEGARIIIADIQETKGREVIQEITNQGGKGRFILTDTSHAQEVQNMVNETIKTYGQVDILFNVAGPGATGGQLDTEEAEFQRQIDGHLKSVFLCTRAVLPHMIERQTGKIVNMGSFAAFGALDGIPAYCAAFGGVIAYTKSVGRFAAPHNINVNSVSPGNILTPMTSAWLSAGNNLEVLKKQIPIGRVGAPEDVAAVCVFLASDLARHIVATDINVSGGQLI